MNDVFDKTDEILALRLATIKRLEHENAELKIRLKWAEERVKLYQDFANETKEILTGKQDPNDIKDINI